MERINSVAAGSMCLHYALQHVYMDMDVVPTWQEIGTVNASRDWDRETGMGRKSNDWSMEELYDLDSWILGRLHHPESPRIAPTSKIRLMYGLQVLSGALRSNGI